MKKVSYMLSRRLLCCCLAMIMVTGLLWSAAARAESVTVRIGDRSFSSEENVLSGWSDGKGWKNLAGKYVAMVDFDGRDTVVSADGGTVTLAVAGVNRIKSLKGRCSFNIVGTGIILLDSIEIEEGSISLMPDISLYDSGSAAVFLLNDGYYELINGSIPGILDESYELDDVKLRVPEGSSLVLSAVAIRSETWMPEGSDAPETEVRIYKNNVPWEDFDPVHENGDVEMKSAAARLTLNGNSSLTVENKATVKLEEITSTAMGRDFISTASAMDIKGTLTNDGTIEGGFINILDGGSLKGNGKVLLSEADLKQGGKLSEKLKLENSGLTVSGDDMSVKADIKDSVIYIKGTGVKLDDLTVSGTSYIGINSEGISGYSQGYCIPEIGDVRFPGGGSLDIVCNNHPYVPGGNDPARYVEDCRLKVTGTVTGGKIRVLAGITEYTGSSTDSIPVVPGGYASRVLVSGFDIDSTVEPLNMDLSDAAELAGEDEIQVIKMTVIDTLVSLRVAARTWSVDTYEKIGSFKRGGEDEFTCSSFIALYGITGSMNSNDCCTAVEIIRSDLSRERFFFDDGTLFSLDDVIHIRILSCTGQGDQGGSAITQTNTSFTGNGNLGGTGNGNVTSGKGTRIYSRYSTPVNTPSSSPSGLPTSRPTASPTSGPTASPTLRPTAVPSGSATPSRTPVRTRRPESTGGREEDAPLVPVVSAKGNGGYELKVYRNGGEIKDLYGLAVRAGIPDTSASDKDRTIYAVFGEGKDTRYIKAEYDAGKGGFVFEADRTGPFRAAYVSVTDVSYTSLDTDAPQFMSLSVKAGDEEIKDLTVQVEAEAEIREGMETGAGLYAVFSGEDEEIHIFPVYCNMTRMRYRFMSDVTGNFVIIKPEGPFKTKSELVEACLSSEEVRIMAAVTRLLEFWS